MGENSQFMDPRRVNLLRKNAANIFFVWTKDKSEIFNPASRHRATQDFSGYAAVEGYQPASQGEELKELQRLYASLAQATADVGFLTDHPWVADYANELSDQERAELRKQLGLLQ